MRETDYLSCHADLSAYQERAQALLEAYASGDAGAAWRFKWEHPHFRGKSVEDVRRADLQLADAREVLAREYGFEAWAQLIEFTRAVSRPGPVATFEEAVEAVVSGDSDTLRSVLRVHPDLVLEQSTRRHHATLLHYIGANGVENARQRTPANAVEIARILLESGAEVDALADMYDERCTTMSMLVSSSPPAEAGLQIELAETLLEYGAAIVGPGTRWQSAVITALAFGFLPTAEALARRSPPLNDIAAAAGLGRAGDTARLLPDADAGSRQIALALAAQHGHADVLAVLLDAGEDPNRFNPDGFHAHSTPLHQAVWGDHADVVRLLVERGARLDVQDTLHHGTPLDWAVYGNRDDIAAYLRECGAPTA